MNIQIAEYENCPKCGGPIRRTSKTGLCVKCQKRALAASPVPGRRKTDRMCRCKVCHKEFALAEKQDPRFTWYCPECRRRMRKITDGIQWLNRIGVDIATSQEEDYERESEREIAGAEPGEAVGLDEIDFFGEKPV